jgi:tetratricopeptide (TPR) repeat protein
MRWLVALALSLLVSRTHAQDTPRRALAALERKPGSLTLLARYASLTLACDGAPSGAQKKSASELLRRLARAQALPSDASTVPDLESEHRLGLLAGYAEALLGRPREGLARLNVAAERQDPESARCARAVAALAVEQGQLELACDALALAAEVLPQDPSTRAELARVWLARGRSDRALPLLAERFAISTAALPARRDLAYALAADGRAAEALSLLLPAREACEADAPCALAAARIALEADRFDDAERFLSARLARDAQDLDALYALADLHTRARRPAQARAAYQQILQLRPNDVRATQALRAP